MSQHKPTPGDERKAAERVTEISFRLRPWPPRRLPETLAAAAAEGEVARMELFLAKAVPVDQPAVGYASPLAAACAFNRLDAVRWLIARGAALEPPGPGISPIQIALGKAHCECAALLLDAGLPVERAAWGVIAAASLGRLDMLLWLLGRGLELDRNYPGVGVLRERALQNLKKEGPADLLKFLKGEIEAGSPPTAPPGALRPGDADVQVALEARSDLLQEALALITTAGAGAARWSAMGPRAPQRMSLVAFAAACGVVEIVTALLEAGARPNHAAEGTPPPLERAAGEAQLEVMRLLLARGALPDGKDGKSWLPLASAMKSGQPEAVRLLLEAGANPKARPAGGPALSEWARGPYAADIRAMVETAAAAKHLARKTK